MTFIFSATIFLSAFLLFLIQPMIGKSLLPLFGGTPAVWNVCLVFFQALLLAGYAYASVIVKIKTPARQIFVHLCLFCLVIAFTYFNPVYKVTSSQLRFTETPILSLLTLLFKRVGVPFFLLSSTSTVLQSWYAHNIEKDKNPYFLYSASNIGSLISLIIFPFIIEPALGTEDQFHYWQLLFALLFAMMIFCSLFSFKGAETTKVQEQKTSIIPFQSIRNWFLLAFIPSGLLIATNTYIATEIASLPLLWMLPLSLFLVTFAIAFSDLKVVQKLISFESILYRMIAFLAVFVIVGIIFETNVGSEFIAFHIALFFLICLLFHLQLSKLRPAVDSLSYYYLIISVGGVCGGIFGSLIAPLIFSGTIEYPLLIALAIFTSHYFADINAKPSISPRDAAFALGIFVASSVLSYFYDLNAEKNIWMVLFNVVLMAAPIIVTYSFLKNRQRFALAIFAIFMANYLFGSRKSEPVVFRSRSFYGTLKVVESKQPPLIKLYHGTTLHGIQSKLGDSKYLPLSYYFHSGPASEVFNKTRMANPSFQNVGIIGLGTGTLSAYFKPNESWDYFELDPDVIAIAQDPKYFSFLGLHKSGLSIFPGDARLSLKSIEDKKYDLLVIDAFSSDSIPTHLLTTEAFALYLQKLKPNGVFAIHISNRYFDFVPLLNAIANNFQMQLLVNHSMLTDSASNQVGINSSKWAVISNDRKTIQSLHNNPGWQTGFSETSKLWTDDYSSLLGLLKFGK